MLNLCLINNSKGFYTPQNKTFKSWLNFLKSNENFEINIVLENKDKMREYNHKYRNKKKFIVIYFQIVLKILIHLMQNIEIGQ